MEPLFKTSSVPFGRMIDGKYVCQQIVRLDKVKLPKDFNGILVIPDNVAQIGKWACRNLSSIKSIVFPDSLLALSSLSFEGCTGIESVDLPKSVISIDPYAFDGCTLLKEIIVHSEELMDYASKFGPKVPIVYK